MQAVDQGICEAQVDSKEEGQLAATASPERAEQ
jgi:hypothetical protein